MQLIEFITVQIITSAICAAGRRRRRVVQTRWILPELPSPLTSSGEDPSVFHLSAALLCFLHGGRSFGRHYTHASSVTKVCQYGSYAQQRVSDTSVHSIPGQSFSCSFPLASVAWRATARGIHRGGIDSYSFGTSQGQSDGASRLCSIQDLQQFQVKLAA